MPGLRRSNDLRSSLLSKGDPCRDDAAVMALNVRFTIGMIVGPSIAGVLPRTSTSVAYRSISSRLRRRLLRSLCSACATAGECRAAEFCGYQAGVEIRFSGRSLWNLFIDIAAMFLPFRRLVAAMAAVTAIICRPISCLAGGGPFSQLDLGLTKNIHRHGLSVIVAAVCGVSPYPSLPCRQSCACARTSGRRRFF